MKKGRPKEKLVEGEDHGLCRHLILYSVNKFWSPAPMMRLTYINQKKFTIVLKVIITQKYSTII